MTKYALRKGDNFVWLDDASGGYPTVHTLAETLRYLLAGGRGEKLGTWPSYENARQYRDMAGTMRGISDYDIVEIELSISTVAAMDKFASASFYLTFLGGDEIRVTMDEYLAAQNLNKLFGKDYEPADFTNDVMTGRVVLS